MEEKNKLTRKQAIKQKCLDCSAYDRKEVKNCEFKECPLYRYRLGVEEV